MRLLPKSQAYTFNFLMVLATDGHSPATGKTVAITISKNGGSFANPAAGATNATEIANGIYKVALGAGDTGTEGDLVVRGTASLCDDLLEVCQVGSPVKLDDKVAHGGTTGSSTATIAAANVNFTNPTGTALEVYAVANGQSAMVMAGGPGGDAVQIYGGDAYSDQPGGKAVYLIGGYGDVAAGAVAGIGLAILAGPDGGAGGNDAVKITANGTGKHDINLAGSGDIVGKLAANALDNVVTEVGLNARQALSLITAALAGVLSGAATTTITIKGAGVATTRIVATVDADGNRSVVILTPPA